VAIRGDRSGPVTRLVSPRHAGAQTGAVHGWGRQQGGWYGTWRDPKRPAGTYMSLPPPLPSRARAASRMAAPPCPYTSGVSVEAADGVDTEMLKLSPDFLEALRRLAPGRRPSRLPYVVCLALLAVAAVIGADPAARDMVAARGRQFVVTTLLRRPSAKLPSPTPVREIDTAARTQPLETGRTPDVASAPVPASTQPMALTAPAKDSTPPTRSVPAAAGKRAAVRNARQPAVRPEGS
jgi:hypothetical protein